MTFHQYKYKVIKYPGFLLDFYQNSVKFNVHFRLYFFSIFSWLSFFKELNSVTNGFELTYIFAAEF